MNVHDKMYCEHGNSWSWHRAGKCKEDTMLIIVRNVCDAIDCLTEGDGHVEGRIVKRFYAVQNAIERRRKLEKEVHHAEDEERLALCPCQLATSGYVYRQHTPDCRRGK